MKFESKSRLGFGIALGTLLAVFWLSYRSAVQNKEDRLWVTHTHLVLEGLDDVAAGLNDLEIAERNFAMSGEEKSLAGFSGCIERLNSLVARVRALTADNPVQQKALDGLDPLLAKDFGGDGNADRVTKAGRPDGRNSRGNERRRTGN
jgi:CHASE3 domain sensor protein